MPQPVKIAVVVESPTKGDKRSSVERYIYSGVTYSGVEVVTKDLGYTARIYDAVDADLAQQQVDRLSSGMILARVIEGGQDGIDAFTSEF